MKTKNNIILVLVLLGLGIPAEILHAQWQTSGSNIYYNGGNVGIGITNPIGQLHVGKQEAPSCTVGSIKRLALQPYGHTGGPWFFTCRDDASSAYMDFYYGTDHIYTIHHGGNIGIGTANPTAKLTVAGGIRAREVKVEANAGADFVFAKGYRLRPLTEVEQFITTNKHLPDIVPADSMVQNGVNMGEMQIKLLQKIEELTLYVIEQEKQIKELKRRLEL